MYDLIDLIFEKYSEGKFSEDKLLLLLEANKTTDNKNNDKEELAKKKKAVAKKIAATLLLIAGISAIIVLCRKNGDTDGEKKLSDIQKNLNKDVKEAKSDLSNAKTVSEVNAIEAKVNNVEKKATSVKRYKVIGDKKLPNVGDYKQAEYKTKDIESKLKPNYSRVSRTEMGKLSNDTKKLVRRYNRIQDQIDRYTNAIKENEYRIEEIKEAIKREPEDARDELTDILKTQYIEFLRRNEEYADKLKEYKDELKQTPEMRTIAKHINKKIDMISDKNEKYNKKLISQNKEWKQKWDGKKLHFVKSSVDDIISASYKYLYMIESVVERYDRDIISYESTMDIIDTICMFEAHNDINNSNMTDEDKNDLLLEANYSNAIKKCKVKELKTTTDKKYNEQLEDQYLYGEITDAEINRVYNKYKRGEELFPAEKKVLLRAYRNKKAKITKGVGVAALAGAAALGGSMALQNHDNKMAKKYNRMNREYYKQGLEEGQRIEREHQERLQRIKKIK